MFDGQLRCPISLVRSSNHQVSRTVLAARQSIPKPHEPLEPPPTDHRHFSAQCSRCANPPSTWAPKHIQRQEQKVTLIPRQSNIQIQGARHPSTTFGARTHWVCHRKKSCGLERPWTACRYTSSIESSDPAVDPPRHCPHTTISRSAWSFLRCSTIIWCHTKLAV